MNLCFTVTILLGNLDRLLELNLSVMLALLMLVMFRDFFFNTDII